MELEFKDVLSILSKKKWILAIFISISILLSGIVSFFIIEKEYQTFVTLMVGRPEGFNGEVSYTDLLANERLVGTYGEIAKSKTVINTVIKNLDLNKTYIELKNKINISLVNDTEIIKIEVFDKDPQQASNIANEISKVLIESINSIMRINNIQVIDKADIPKNHSRPKPIINIMVTALVSTVVSIMGIVLLEYLDNTIKSAEDVEQVVRLPVIGTVPLNKGKMDYNQFKVKNMYIEGYTKNILLEAFRMLRTNLQFLNFDRNIKSIMITSSKSSEGKSYVCTNLAFAFAIANKKVLLIDADLRQPTIHKYFNMPGVLGVTNILNEDIDYNKVIFNTEINELDILLAGIIPPNPSELLASEKMSNFLKSLRDIYDVIIIDSPPAGIVADASILATITDGVILVCSANETKIEAIEKTKNILVNLNTNLLGVVLNKLKLGRFDYYSYQYTEKTKRKKRDYLRHDVTDSEVEDDV